jgi:hypothetical protein
MPEIDKCIMCSFHQSRRMELEFEIRKLQAKLDFLKRFVEAEDGIFCFPNGDMLEGCGIKNERA